MYTCQSQSPNSSLTTLAFLKSSSLGFLGFEILYKFSFQISLTNVLMFFHRLFLFYLFLTECCSLPFLVLLFSLSPCHSTKFNPLSHLYIFSSTSFISHLLLSLFLPGIYVMLLFCHFCCWLLLLTRKSFAF